MLIVTVNLLLKFTRTYLASALSSCLPSCVRPLTGGALSNYKLTDVL